MTNYALRRGVCSVWVGVGNLLWDTSHYAEAYDLTIDEIHTYFVATAEDTYVLVHNNNCLFSDGDVASMGDVLRGGQDFVGPGAKELEPGVFRSLTTNADGSYNVFRITDEDLATVGNHSPRGLPHANFEVHVPVMRGSYNTGNLKIRG